MSTTPISAAADPAVRALEQLSDMNRQIEVAIAAVARNSLVDFENSLWHQEMLCEALKRSVLLLRDSVQNDDARERLSEALASLFRLNRTYSSLMVQSSHTAAVLHDLCSRYASAGPLQIAPRLRSFQCEV